MFDARAAVSATTSARELNLAMNFSSVIPNLQSLQKEEVHNRQYLQIKALNGSTTIGRISKGSIPDGVSREAVTSYWYRAFHRSISDGVSR